MESFYSSIHDDKIVGMLALDLRKAFDNVSTQQYISLGTRRCCDFESTSVKTLIQRRRRVPGGVVVHSTCMQKI